MARPYPVDGSRRKRQRLVEIGYHIGPGSIDPHGFRRHLVIMSATQIQPHGPLEVVKHTLAHLARFTHDKQPPERRAHAAELERLHASYVPAFAPAPFEARRGITMVASEAVEMLLLDDGERIVQTALVGIDRAKEDHGRLLEGLSDMERGRVNANKRG